MSLNSCRNFISARHPILAESSGHGKFLNIWKVASSKFYEKEAVKGRQGQATRLAQCVREGCEAEGQGPWCGLEALAWQCFPGPANSPGRPVCRAACLVGKQQEAEKLWPGPRVSVSSCRLRAGRWAHP